MTMHTNDKPHFALVVDDEEAVEVLFKQRFRKELKAGKVTFHFALSGEEALDFLHSTEATDIVLVLSDINMPGMTGLELLRRIKAEYSELPVHMVTAYGNEYYQQKAVEYGADGYLDKPIDFSFLKQEVFGLEKV